MDALYNIGLWCDLQTSISILNTCKSLWDRRQLFYQEKNLLWYNKPLINISSPEVNFYITNRQFTIFIEEEDEDGDIHVSYIYELNNSIKHLQRDDIMWKNQDFTFYIENCYMVIWYSPKIEFYSSRKEFLKSANSNINKIYIDIDLTKSIPVWTNYHSIPRIKYDRYEIRLNKNGNVVHKGI